MKHAKLYDEQRDRIKTHFIERRLISDHMPRHSAEQTVDVTARASASEHVNQGVQLLNIVPRRRGFGWSRRRRTGP